MDPPEWAFIAGYILENRDKFAKYKLRLLESLEEQAFHEASAKGVLESQPLNRETLELLEPPQYTEFEDFLNYVLNHMIEWVNAEPLDAKTAWVDGSSRIVDDPFYKIGLYAAGAFLEGDSSVEVYPYLGYHGEPILPEDLEDKMHATSLNAPPDLHADLEPYTYVKPLFYIKHEELSSLGQEVFPYSSYFGYNTKTMLDENRILLETTIALYLIERDYDVIILDGPIYSTPGLLERLAKTPLSGKTVFRSLVALYSLNYLYNIIARLLLSAAAHRKELLIIGVVKRLSGSKMFFHSLFHVPTQGDVLELSDEEIARLIADRERERGISGDALLIGPILTRVEIGSVLRSALKQLIKEILVMLRDEKGAKKVNDKTITDLLCGGRLDIIAYDIRPNLRADAAHLLKALDDLAGTGLTSKNVLCSIWRKLYKPSAGGGGLEESLGSMYSTYKLSYYLVVPSPYEEGVASVLRLEAPVAPEPPFHTYKSLEEEPLYKAVREAAEALKTVAPYIVHSMLQPRVLPYPLGLSIIDKKVKDATATIARSLVGPLQGILSLSPENLQELGLVGEES